MGSHKFYIRLKSLPLTIIDCQSKGPVSSVTRGFLFTVPIFAPEAWNGRPHNTLPMSCLLTVCAEPTYVPLPWYGVCFPSSEDLVYLRPRLQLQFFVWIRLVQRTCGKTLSRDRLLCFVALIWYFNGCFTNSIISKLIYVEAKRRRFRSL